jgi:hypothetical protein
MAKAQHQNKSTQKNNSMKDETKRETVNTNDGITSARPLPCHTEPYRKVYNKFGELMNPITKSNPYFVKQKRRIPKTRKKAVCGEYVQFIPTFVDDIGMDVETKKVTYRIIDSKVYPSWPFNVKFAGWKQIIHQINKPR